MIVLHIDKHYSEVTTKELKFPDGDRGFELIREKNKALRHCNGCYYTPKSEEDKKGYETWQRKHPMTIGEYYKNVTVD